jgi:hypothetical protein
VLELVPPASPLQEVPPVAHSDAHFCPEHEPTASPAFMHPVSDSFCPHAEDAAAEQL